MHFGYRVVAALVLTSFIPLSLALSCAGIFYPSLSAYLDVEPGFLSYYTSILWLATLLTLPIMGNILDKGDARVCMTAAVAIITVTFVWLSFTSSVWQFFIAAFAMGISVGMLLFLAPSTLINRWFHKRAGFYLGIAMAFTGIGGVVFSSIGGMLIESIGWSMTYIVFAILSACTIPATLFMVSSHPKDKGLLPVGLDATESEQESFEPEGISASQAFRMPVFYIICIMSLVLSIGMYMYFMIPSYSTNLAIGIEFPLLGATASSVAMAGQTISKLVLGSIGERIPQTATITALSIGILGVMMFMLFDDSIPIFYASALFFGIYYGITNVMTPIFTRLCFGVKDYARIYSRVSTVTSIGNVAAAFIWGTIIDATGSYMPTFTGIVALMAITILLVIAIGVARKRLLPTPSNHDLGESGASNAPAQ